MSTIAQEILDSISTLIDGSLQRQENVKVIECTIEGLIDASIGLYDVVYLKQHLKAYTNTITTQYSKDDSVYVLSQDGNLDGKLIIIGSSNPYVGLYDVTSEVQYKKIGETVFESVNNNEEIAFCTYHSPEEKQLTINTGSNFNIIFSHYLENYKTFCLNLGTRTSIEDPYQKVNGDYGIVLNVPFVRNIEGKTEQVTRTYYFNTEQMEGSPYDYINMVNQKTYITFDDDLTYDSSRDITMSAFCKGFSVSSDSKYDDYYDIFLSNIQFYPVEVIDASAVTGYHMILTATEGNYFLNNRFRTTKEITPTLLINGKETNYDNLPCYWFVQDNSVDWGSPYYNSIGGYGWKCLNGYSIAESSDGTASENILNTDVYSISVKQSDVVTTLKYKCVIIYNNTVVSRDITIENLDTDVKITLTSNPSFVIRDSLITLTCDVTTLSDYIAEGSYLTYAWMRYNSAGDYIDNDFWHKDSNCKTNYVTTLDNTMGLRKYTTDVVCYGSSITDSMNLFACTVYLAKEDGSNILLGTTQILIALNSIDDTYLSMLNSNKLYKYDGYGNSPMTEAYDGPLSSRVAVLEPLSFVLYKRNGEEYSEEEYDYCKVTWSLPKNSMMNFKISEYQKTLGIVVTEDNDYYHVTKQGKFDIEYTICSYFSYAKTDNSVILNVNLSSENIVSGTADIQFVKEGENGTNGTQFSVLLTYNGIGYDKKDSTGIRQKLKLIYIAGSRYDKWYTLPTNTNIIPSDMGPYEFPSNGLNPFGIEVYKDGSLIDNIYSYKVEWSIFDEQAIKPFFTITSGGKLVPAANRENKWKTISMGDNKILVAQAKVTVTTDSSEDADTVIYAYYPIELLRVDKELFEKMTFFPSLDGGYSIVTYESDGSNPKWDTGNNDNIFEVHTSMEMEDVPARSFKHEWRISDKLIMKSQTEDAAKITPAGKYDDASANNYVSVVMYPNLSDSTTKITEEEIQEETDNNNAIIDDYSKRIARNVIQYEELKNLGSSFDIEQSEEEIELISEIETIETQIITQKEKKATLTKNYETNIEARYPDRGTDNYASAIGEIIAELTEYEDEVYDILMQIFKTTDNYTVENMDYVEQLIDLLKIQNPAINNQFFLTYYNNYLSANDKLEKAETEISSYRGSIDSAKLNQLEGELSDLDILDIEDRVLIEELLSNDSGYSEAIRIKAILDMISTLDEFNDDNYTEEFNLWCSLLDNFNNSYQEALNNYANAEKAIKDNWKVIIEVYVAALSELIINYVENYLDEGETVEDIDLSDDKIIAITNQLQIDYNNLTNIKNCELGTYTSVELLEVYNSMDENLNAIFNNNNGIFNYGYVTNNYRGSLQKYLERYESYTAYVNDYEVAIETIENGSEGNGKDTECIQYLEKEKEQKSEELKVAVSKRISELSSWLDKITEDNEYLSLRSTILDKLSILETIINKYQVSFENMFTDAEDAVISASYSWRTIVNNAKLEIYKCRYKTYGLLNSNFKAADIATVNSIPEYTGLKALIKETLSDTDGNTTADSILDLISSYDETVIELVAAINKIKALDTSKEDEVQSIYDKINAFINTKIISNTSITSDTINNQINNLYNIPEMEIYIKAIFNNSVLTSVNELLQGYTEETLSLTVFEEVVKEDRNFPSWNNALNKLLSKFAMSVNESSASLDDYEREWNNISIANRITSSINYQNIIIKTFINLLSLYFNCIYSDNKITVNINDITGDFIEINAFTKLDTNDDLDVNTLVTASNHSKIIESRGKILQCNESSYITFLKPIVFRLNTNEFGWLNDWDGNKLYLDEEGEYILAPQIGAGTKDEANRFTGITMGAKRTQNKLDSDIGLFGFCAGQQSIFLDAKSGKAQFGLSGEGQINLDPRDNTAKLYSGNFYEWNSDGTPNYRKETGKGLLIDLTTPEIRFGSGGFWVDKDGNMHVGGNSDNSVSANKEPTSGAPEEGTKGYDSTGVYYNNGYNRFYYDENIELYKAEISKKGFSSTETPLLKTDTSGYYFYEQGGNVIQVWLNRDIFVRKDETGVIENVDIGPYVRETTISTLNSKNVAEETSCYYYYDDSNNIRYYFYDSEIEQYLFYDDDGRFWYWDEELETKVYYEPDTNLYFYYDSSGVKTYLKDKNSELGGWYVGKDRIYSENHKMTLYSAYGDPTKSPAVYSGTGYKGDVSESNESRLHSTFISNKDGFYLGDEGLSVGKLVRASNDEFYLGDDKNDKKYFRAYMDDDTDYGKIEIGLIKGDVSKKKYTIGDEIIYTRNVLPDKPAAATLHNIYKINTQDVDSTISGNEEYQIYDKYYLYSYEQAEEWTDITTEYYLGLTSSEKGIHPGDTDAEFKETNNKYDKKWELGASKKAAYFYFNTERASDEYLKEALEIDDEEEHPRKNFNIDMAMLDGTKVNPKRIYLGSDGMLVSNQFKIDIGGNVEIGDVKTGMSWRFNTARKDGVTERAFMFFTPPNENEKADNSAAKYDVTGAAANATIYVGTDGIRVGNFFRVNPSPHWGASMGSMSFGPLADSRHWDIITWTQNGHERPYIIGEGGDIGINDGWSVKTNGDGGIFRENRVNDKRDYEPIMGRASINKRRIIISPTMIMGGDTFYLDSTPEFNGGSQVTCQIKASNFYIGIPDETTSEVDIEGKKFARTTYMLLEDYIRSIGGGGGGNLPQAENYSF